MGKKFTSEDLFRIGEFHLSDFEAQDFRFTVLTAGFRETISEGVSRDVKVSADERNLLEKIITKLGRKGSILSRGGR